MKAIVQRRYGSADVLDYADIDRPVLGDGDVLVRVRGSAFRAYVHPARAIDSVVRQQGLSLRSVRDTFV